MPPTIYTKMNTMQNLTDNRQFAQSNFTQHWFAIVKFEMKFYYDRMRRKIIIDQGIRRE